MNVRMIALSVSRLLLCSLLIASCRTKPDARPLLCAEDLVAALKDGGMDVVQVSDVPLRTNLTARAEVAICTADSYDEWVWVHEYDSESGPLQTFPEGVYRFADYDYPVTIVRNLAIFMTPDHSKRDRVVAIAKAMH